MFDFIKKLFSEEEKEEIEKERVKLNDIDKWLDSFEKKQLASFSEKTSPFINQVKEEIKKTRENLENLRNAKLRNEKIPPKARHMMEGSRDIYIRKVALFLDNIASLAEKNDPDAVHELCQVFESGSEELSKSTQRSYMVLQEFFSRESREIAINIKKIDASVKSLKKTLKGTGLEIITEIKKDAEHLHNKLRQKKGFEDGIEKKKKIMEEMKKSLENLEKEKESLIKSDDYNAAAGEKAKNEALSAKMRNKESELLHLFSAIEKALRKYERMTTDEAVVRSYLASPSNALLKDNELKIIGVLSKMKDAVARDQLDLKDKKKEKTIEVIEKLSRDYLEAYRKEHEDISEEKKKLEQSIASSSVLNKINETDGRITRTKEEMRHTNSSLETLEHESGKISEKDLVQHLEKKMNDNLPVKVEIS